LNVHHQFQPPLKDGLQQVIALFNSRLSEHWEMYVQPHLNGLRPDIVLLSPKAGIAVFKINDGEICRKDIISLQEKVIRNKHAIYDIYCPRLDNKSGLAAITAGLIFPGMKVDEVRSVLDADGDGQAKAFPIYHPVSGIRELSDMNLDCIFPQHRWHSSRFMNPEIAEDLRGWLREPHFSQESREPLYLDARQLELATTRNLSGYRRIKGPAGSGKSMVLAARASEVAAEGKKALVLTFNITLMNYLRRLAYRHGVAGRVMSRELTFLHFHLWCKHVCEETEHLDEYVSLWPPKSMPPKEREKAIQEVLDTKMAMLVQSLYRNDRDGSMPRYGAILVDEGQDYNVLWWQTLSLALAEGGEMLLVADKTQDIYGKAATWTESVMSGAGFSGRWVGLDTSYRLPPAIIPLVKSFATQFLTGQDSDVPVVDRSDGQIQLPIYPVKLRWVQIDSSDNLADVCVSEVKTMMTNLSKDSAVCDITVITPIPVGKQAVNKLLFDNNLKTMDTFGDDEYKESQRKKLAFFTGDKPEVGGNAMTIRVTTLHSFKGWEARHLVVVIDRAEFATARAVIYTALTRIQRHPNGSALSVVSCCPELLEFGREWPDFDRHTNTPPS